MRNSMFSVGLMFVISLHFRLQYLSVEKRPKESTDGSKGGKKQVG